MFLRNTAGAVGLGQILTILMQMQERLGVISLSNTPLQHACMSSRWQGTNANVQAHFEAYQVMQKPEMPTTTRDSTGSQSRKDFRVGDR